MKRPVFHAFYFLLILAASCTGENVKQRDAEYDVENEKVTRAERFSLVTLDSCSLLTIIDPWQGAKGQRQTWYLVEKGRKPPGTAKPESVIYTPVERIICLSTTHLAMVTALGKEDAVAGVSGAEFIYNERISTMIADGLISDVGYEAGMNSELIIKTAPDLVMMYGIGNESAAYTSKITELGIKVLFNADYLETDPLGKAEWIKLFGALFLKEEMADSIFNAVSEAYDDVRKIAAKNSEYTPSVLLGLPFRDTWYISPGNSYISKLISDAGGSYLWSDTESSLSMPYALETVFMKAQEADYWLNTGSADSGNDILAMDKRLGSITCFKNGNLYNNNKRITTQGGNDYWESGTINPHIILKDIASILHPGIFGNYEMIYYKKINK